MVEDFCLQFSLSMLRFFKNSDLLFVRDVTNSLGTWPSTNMQKKKCSYNWMRSSKPIPNGTNPSSVSSDDNKTTNLASGLDRASRELVFRRKIFGVRSCWKFYHRYSSCRWVYPESFRFFPHMVRKIFTNYLLIN